MKIERVFVLRFDDGGRIPYGVPEFLSEDEAKDFLAHVQGELSEGAAAYFATCCQEGIRVPGQDVAGDDEQEDDEEPVQADRSRGRVREISFAEDPSARVRRLERVANGLRRLGLQLQAVRARQVEVVAQQERQRQLEQEQLIQLTPQQSKGLSR